MDIKQIKNMCDDIDASATILLALSKDRKTLHIYSSLDAEGRKAMAKVCNSNLAVRDGLKSIFDNLGEIVSSAMMMDTEEKTQ